jgi:hypothetical protein
VEPGALLPGTLDLLRMTGGALTIEQGRFYPPLYRLEDQCLLRAAWGT